MKNSRYYATLVLAFFLKFAMAQEIAPYMLVGESSSSLEETGAIVSKALTDKGFMKQLCE